MRYLVAYDIAHPRRLQRVAKILKDYGLRLQHSVFEIEVEETVLKELQRRLARVIVPTEDGVKYFPLCGTCPGPWLVLGRGPSGEMARPFLVV
jgi:CRISPR-associated protein Cas2